jgi:nucleoside-diphosphate-sugar epimerase
MNMDINMSHPISVYGSTGFIGSRFCSMYPDSIRIPKDANSPESDSVLYFISTVHNYNIFTEPHKDINTNLNKLIDVLEACRANNSNTIFNFVSSWFVYGMNCTMDTKETVPCDPTGFYSITKRAAEQMLICYCNTFGLKYRILRLTNIIGEGDAKVSAKKNAIQHMIGLLKQNELVKLYDDGSNVRDFMYVEDTCRALKTCMDNSPTNEIINISNRDPHSIGSIIRYSKEKLGSSSELISIEASHFHKVVQVRDVCLNNDKLLSYGYVPSINTFEAVDRILAS